MSELKTQANDADVSAFIDGVEHDRRREDARVLLEMMQRVTGEPPRMWGSSIVGFGSYDYRNASGREGTWFLTGFSPRKQSMSVYIMPGFSDHDALMGTLGKHKTGRSCLYINKLDDVDLDVLETLVERSVAYMREKYGA